MIFRGSRRRSFWSRLVNRPEVEGVLSASGLEQAFQSERARVDRNHQVFSMVIFLPTEGRDICPKIVATLRERMRVYDVIGQLDRRRIALLLPETDSDGAWTFADDALGRLASDGLAYNCEVYCYPLDWASKGRRRTDPQPKPTKDDQNWPEDQSGDATGTDGSMLRVLDRNATDKDALIAPTLEVVRHPRSQRDVQDLAPIFIDPLPWTRRVIDVVIAAVALVLLSPVFLLLALLIKLDTPGPVFFVKKRAGLGGAPFKFIKFRSMYLDADERRREVLARNEHKSGPIFKLKNDPRITPVGRWLRRTSLDEFPQLYNVLLGDMTLIGPRPPLLEEVADYEAWQRRRLDVTGGLTCIWQVSGRSEVGFKDWVRMDIQYQEKRSLTFDLRLVLRTFGAVLSGRGAY
jgi:lipopolysaccharide/colanic/teichoic acid biosynthesis glycosyltransferase